MSVRLPLIAFALAIMLTGCGAPQGQSASGTAPAPAAPKRITAAISGDPRTVYALFGAAGVRGADSLNSLVNSGLAIVDHTQTLHPVVAETVPTVENGLWQVFPDGTMAITWRLRNGVQWHDGTPVSFDDLVFTTQVLRDRDLPFPVEAAALTGLQDLQALDSRTVLMRWSRLYVSADRIFASIALPLPKHLLQNTYLNNKGSFTDLPYWSSGFVGVGPFKVKEWVPGTSVMLAAFDAYALGRPKIDEIELRFVLDANVLVANVLAGDIDVTLGRSFSPEQGALVRQQWQDGRVDIGQRAPALNVWPQFVDPNPVIVADVRFRRAMYRALDRQTMADVLEGGLAPVAQSWLIPSIPEYHELEHYIARYDYDPQAAIREIEALGYARGPDGMFRDGSGQRLSVELRTTSLPEINPQTQLTVRDDWQRAGVTVTVDSLPPQSTDPAYFANYPAFYVVRFPADVFSGTGTSSGTIQGRVVPKGRYSNPDLDALMERFEITMSRTERLEITGQIVHHMTDQVTVMPLFYDPGIGFVRNRLLNVPTLGDDPPWNAYEWDLR